ncbi:cytochrome c oxidase assembly protein [Microvirga roseola]|uniref:cytochrome c oxidase assembly protein n=1 Tax=Microvirga roseola TaxID=2883126 RepID=UPI002AC33BCB|nr:cytochrome c oxidase assembly protein [Microvirga roseola]
MRHCSNCRHPDSQHCPDLPRHRCGHAGPRLCGGSSLRPVLSPDSLWRHANSGGGLSGKVLERTVAVTFDTNVAPELPWRFSAETPAVRNKVGETQTVMYKISNPTDAPVSAMATYNVQPDLAGSYFMKLECFCFTELLLGPGETKETAVVFLIDPAIVDDRDIGSLDGITLSYTYFPPKGGNPDQPVGR